ncbi:MAG: cytochrome c [Microcoleus sp. PH2017_10_PVI_O_A]|uniref:c-type cytochrome n=1 Tax=unclassified Microcoleus TaxID=2642155 RepID=UPI001D9B4E98|nr:MULTISPECIES: cytochrome c [unclassified Microcoleus]TAE83870.1 MAG: cytochrome c [Oscillatoriales cyanobacterium]MCC3405738.1 cytochrome c [Microcoleus sp. PH2017_10_PVI_O_A]MCC3459748.1 cytochrome c [Microcoleus sp. PH2017_11_PCY_U_A]MCC3477746.1 cytochrome c [Microcoleus sp. PH2017_12_PCY_D_A]MCC3529332.1 cytochrome c [Microcoleus sp. PH2017_21_RUC_O_A]
MNHQIATNELKNPIERLVIFAIALLLAIMLATMTIRQFQVADPYVKSVLSLTGDQFQGSAIFHMNCAGCHISVGDTQVGPNLHRVSDRKSEFELIRQVTSGRTPPMPQFQPSPQEMADLLKYLQQM